MDRASCIWLSEAISGTSPWNNQLLSDPSHLYCIEKHCTVKYFNVKQCTVKHFTVKQYNLKHFPVKHFTVKHCTVKHCTVKHCNVKQSLLNFTVTPFTAPSSVDCGCLRWIRQDPPVCDKIPQSGLRCSIKDIRGAAKTELTGSDNQDGKVCKFYES